MIPVSLHLNNFMSYKSLDIDFTEIHVACLSGENGAGKSTILDAITWCIWDESRASHNDDLIKIGENEMTAELIFDIDMQRYKVIRNSKKLGKKKVSVQSGVEVQILAEKGYKSITGKTTRETNERLLEIVKMNYETFVNSAFILQGKADAFTTKKPTERKKLLADILNLNQYKSLEEKTKKILKTFQDERKLIEREAEHNQTRIQDEESIKVALEVSQKELENSNEYLCKTEEKLNNYNEQKQNINIKLSALNQLYKQLNESKDLKEKNTNLISKLESNIKTYEDYIAKRDEIETNFNLLKDLKNKENILSDKLIKNTEINKKINTLKADISNKKHKLELKLSDLNSKIMRLEEDKVSSEKNIKDEEKILKIYADYNLLKDEQNQYNERIVKFNKLTEKKSFIEKKLNDELNKLKIEEGNFREKIKDREEKVKSKRRVEEQKNSIEVQLQEIEKQNVYLESVKSKGLEIKAKIKSNDDIVALKKEEIPLYQEKINKWLEVHDANCPMCNNHVNEEEKQLIIQKYKNDLYLLENEIDKINGENASLNKQADEYRDIYKKLFKEVNQKNDLARQVGEIQKTLSDIIENEKELVTLKKELNNINEKITRRNFSVHLQKELSEINLEIEQLEYNPETISVIQAKINSLSYIEIKYSQLESDKKKYANVEKELPPLISEKESIVKSVETEMFAETEINELKNLNVLLNDINYNESEHSDIKNNINELKIYDEKYDNLHRSIALIDSKKEQVNTIKEDNLKISETINTYEAQVKEIPDLENNLRLINDSLNEENLNKKALIEQIDLIKDGISKNTEKINYITKLKSEIQESVSKYTYLDKEIELHKDLVNAFSKDGIQAIIIENAIPEIENYANQLIMQMTEGRMNIKFSTIKSNRTNENVSETLDIYISDELGIRNYEMYSGGEAFRVNFAIRLALSKMLAKRAGTKLKTLVIDEGFGTQDSKGISKLIEAINIVKKDFDKILIITHINDLKEAFNDRIEVYKTIHGSEVRIVS